MPIKIDVKQAREMFSYHPSEGILRTRIRRKMKKPGDPIGCKNVCGPKGSEKTYIRTYINGLGIYAHRIIWVLMTGEQPDCIDHIDGDGLNNKWKNLRDVSHIKNCQNQRIHTTNTSGASGVTYRKDSNRWRARIMVDGTMISLGTFETFDEAKKVRLKAESLYYD